MGVGHYNTKRARPTPTPARSGESSKLRSLQETARREVELSSSYLEYNSKPGLNRSLRPLLCQGQHIFKQYFKDVSREFDEFRVNAHLCKQHIYTCSYFGVGVG